MTLGERRTHVNVSRLNNIVTIFKGAESAGKEMKKAATYLLVCAGVLLSHHANAKNAFDSAVDGYNQGLNNRINAQRAYIDAYTNGVNARNAINSEARQQCNYFQQTFQSNVPNWSGYRNNNEFIQWANKSTVQVNNGQNITVASAIDQIINTCNIRDMPALRSWLDAFDSNK